MTVGFYHVGPAGTRHMRLATAMVASVKRVMRDVRVLQLTDRVSTLIEGIDGSCVLPERPIARGCLEAYAFCDGPWLFLDTDVIVQRDVRHVFDHPFDIAVADRAGTLTDKDLRGSLVTRMPFNKGAVFSRSQPFWRAPVDRIAALSQKAQAWMGDQQAMCDEIASGRWHVEILPNAYNYPPRFKGDDVSGKAIVHYKGSVRKTWALERAA
jgi:hypothetical protein